MPSPLNFDASILDSSVETTVSQTEAGGKIYHIHANTSDILGMRRSGDDLTIVMKSGETIRIEGFFSGKSETHFIDQYGDDWLLTQPPQSEAFTFSRYISDEAAGANGGVIPSPLGLQAAAAGLMGGAFLAGKNASKKPAHIQNDVSDEAVQDTPASSLPTSQNVLISRPSAQFSRDLVGLSGSVKGLTEGRVELRDSDGNLIGEASLAADGSFSITLQPAATPYDGYGVTAFDPNGNSSDPYFLLASHPDDQAPDAAKDLVLHANGAVLTGKGEAGSRVTVTFADKMTATAMVDQNGDFSIHLPKRPADQEVLNVTLTDAAGNTSPVTTITASVDSDAPDAPVGQVIGNGTLLIGTGEAGATVEVKRGATTLTTVVDGTGQFRLPLVPAAEKDEKLQLVLIDPAGNRSDAVEVTAPARDIDGPDAPTGQVIGNGALLIGTGEVGATVEVKRGATTLTTVVDGTGQFRLPLVPAAEKDEKLQLVLIDPAGNRSDTVEVTAPARDTDEPDAPTGQVIGNGALLIGTGEAGATVEVKRGATTLTTVVDGTGQFRLPLVPAAEQDEKLQLVLIDPAGNRSDTVEVTAPARDTDEPDAPVGQVIGNGTLLIGTGEAGATVEVKRGATTLTTVVDGTGQFRLPLVPAAEQDEKLQLVLIDPAGNRSDTVEVTAPARDTDEPDAPTGQVIGNGTLLIGTGEAGATVEVKRGATTLTTVVDGTGQFRLPLVPAAEQDEKLQLVLIDPAGNRSDTVEVTAPARDIDGPDQPVGQVSGNGVFVTGKGEPGSVLTLTHAEAEYVTLVDAAGNFVVKLVPSAGNGDTITLVLHDAAGNISPSQTITAQNIDIEPPSAPTIAGFDPSGTYLLGEGEPFATIIIKDARTNDVVGSGIAGSNGSFMIKVTPQADNKDPYTITQTDLAGNISPAATHIADGIDRDAPDAPVVQVMVNSSVEYLKGKGEPGARITYSRNDGAKLYAGLVGSDGTFIIPLTDPVQVNDSYRVWLTDAAGNESLVGRSDVLAVDRTPPTLSDLKIDINGGALRGVTNEAEAKVTVILIRAGDGSVLDPPQVITSTGRVNANGTFVVALDPRAEKDAVYKVYVTDEAGNISPKLDVAAGLIDTAATAVVDNTYTLQLDVTPSITKLGTSQRSGFALANLGVGGVISADVLNFDSTTNIVVADSTMRVLTLQADAGGVTLLSKFNLKVMRLLSNGQWETFSLEPNFLEVSAFGGKSGTMTLQLPAGTYNIILEGSSGVQVLTGYTLFITEDIVMDYSAPALLAGNHSGNVIQDFDPAAGRDYLPAGKGELYKIQLLDDPSVFKFVSGGTTTIKGLYGALTITHDGSWSYKLDEGLDAQVFGKLDRFVYTIAIDPSLSDAGNFLTAALDITLSPTASATAPTGTMAHVTLDFTPQKYRTVNGKLSPETSFELLDVANLGQIINASVLGNDPKNVFTVAADQMRILSLGAEGGGIEINGVYDLVFYKQVVFSTAAGGTVTQWVEYHVDKAFLKVGFLGGRTDPKDFSFTQGTYAVFLKGGSTLGLLKGTTLVPTDDWTVDYTKPETNTGEPVSGTTSGTLVTTAHQGEVVSVNGIAAAKAFASMDLAAQNLTLPATMSGKTGWMIQGDHGKLWVATDGSYVYVLDSYDASKGLPPPYGEDELFTYVKVEDGKTTSSSLTVTIDMVDPKAITQQPISVDMENRIADWGVSRDITSSNDIFGDNVKKVTGGFTVAADTRSFVTFEAMTDVLVSGSVTSAISIKIYEAPSYEGGPAGRLVASVAGTPTGRNNEDSVLALTNLGDLAAGKYVYEIVAQRSTSGYQMKWGYELNVHSVYDSEYTEVKPAQAVTTSGLLVDASLAWSKYVTRLEIGGQGLQINSGTGPASMTILGKYGSLLVKQDGSFVYTANSVAFGTETFTYTMLTATGTSVSNTLSFTVDMDLHPITEVGFTSFLTGAETTYELPSAQPSTAPFMQRSLFMAQAQVEGDEALSDDAEDVVSLGTLDNAAPQAQIGQDDPTLDAHAADSLFEPAEDKPDMIELPEEPAPADQIGPDQAAADGAAAQGRKSEADVVAIDPPVIDQILQDLEEDLRHALV